MIELDRDRLTVVVNYLKIKGTINKISEISAKLNVHRSYLSNVMAGREKLSIKLVRSLCEAYKLPFEEWVMTGKGVSPDMLLASKEDISTSVTKFYRNLGKCSDLVENEPEQLLVAPMIGAELAFELNGKVYFVDRWIESFIDWGKEYVVKTDTGYLMVKKIRPSGDDELILADDDAGVPDIKIKTHELGSLYLVKGIMSFIH